MNIRDILKVEVPDYIYCNTCDKEYKRLKEYVVYLEDLASDRDVSKEIVLKFSHGYEDIAAYIGDTKIIRFQFIMTEYNPQEFINNTFDLEFCKVTFDGRGLNICNLESVLTRKSDLFPNLSLIKYVMVTEGVDMNEALNIREDIRLSKYKNRGFDVKKHYFYDDILDYFRDKMYTERFTPQTRLGIYRLDDRMERDGKYYFIVEQLGKLYGKMFEADFTYINHQFENIDE